MKVFIALSQLKGHGGIPRFNQNLLDAITPLHHTDVLSLNDAGDHDMKGANRNKLIFATYFLISVLKRPDVIVLGHINLIPMLLLKIFSNARTVVILHGIDAWEPKPGSEKYYHLVHEFWSVSQYTKRTFCEVSQVSEDRVKMIFNTLPKTWDTGSGASTRENYFLTVTRVDKAEGYKGIDKTIQAIGNIQAVMREKKWHFRGVLSGDDVERHQGLSRDLKVDDLIHFESNISDEQLKERYSRAGFFILPSAGEGFGIVFLEAMAHQKACIGARHCGSEDVIEDGQTGFLIDPGVETIASRLLALINSPELCASLGKNGKDKLQRTFMFDQFTKLINKRLKECVA